MTVRHFLIALTAATLIGEPAVWAQTTPSPADQAFTQAMQQMQQTTSSTPMTGKTDQDFVMMMVPHHQAAVAMAHTELKYGKSAYLKRMARKIIKSQNRQIKQMGHWKAKHPNTP